MAAVKYWFQTGVKLWTIGLLAWVPAGFADATDSLTERLAGMESYAADFTQQVRGAQGQVIERSSGLVRIVRPNFKWLVDTPYPQVIVADGEYLRVYDPDLEQVTLRPLEEALTDTPISLLTQDEVELTQHFAVRAGEDSDTYVLTPLSADSMYAEIHIAFAGANLVWLAIVDHLGQLTEIEFIPAADTTVIQSDEFLLTLPPGTDVIGG
jgi:outer membrane lipoprotein carrier protein